MHWTEKGKGAEEDENGTWKVTEDRDSLLTKLLLAFGTDACIIHASEFHMFRLSESPTNIIFFPLHLLRKSAPSNLQLHKQQVVFLFT